MSDFDRNEELNSEEFQTDILLIAYAAGSFLAFVLALSSNISPGQSASCFAVSCVLALIGMNISSSTPAQTDEEDDFFF